MPEQTQIIYSHRDVVESLVRKAGLHEGLWGLYIEFGISATNLINQEDKIALPAAVVPVVKIGIQRFEQPNSFTVDASKLE
jgi:hypothetical protein